MINAFLANSSKNGQDLLGLGTIPFVHFFVWSLSQLFEQFQLAFSHQSLPNGWLLGPPGPFGCQFAQFGCFPLCLIRFSKYSLKMSKNDQMSFGCFLGCVISLIEPFHNRACLMAGCQGHLVLIQLFCTELEFPSPVVINVATQIPLQCPLKLLV